MRKSHTKSHTGCMQCKTRKIKCNEALPACGACVRRQERCSFLEFTQPAQGSNCYACGQIFGQSGLTTTERSPRGLLELDLTHFFLIETLPSILFSETRRDTWRRSIFPHDALTHPADLDAHLATAAMHKIAIGHQTALESPKYLEFAVEKQAIVLSTFVPMLSNPTAANARTLFALAALVTIWSFASRSLPPQLNIVSKLPFNAERIEHGHAGRGRLADIIYVIKISQGIGAVVDQCRHWLFNEGLACMIKSQDMSAQPFGEQACDELGRLHEMVQDAYHDQQSRLQMYTEAIRRTRSFLGGMCTETSQHVALGWSVGLPHDFMKAASDHEPTALVIVAFWSACLHHTRFWWAAGWGADVVWEVNSHLSLPWQRFMEWPMAAVAVQ